MKVCVVGGGGCFGLDTTQYFLNRGHEVLGVGRNPPKSPPFSLSIQSPRYKYRALHIGYELDLLMELLDEEKPEVIVNYAALAEVPLSWKHPEKYYETNVTAHVKWAKELSKRTWLRKFIHVSTSELYGSNDHPVTEDAPIRCSSPYAVSKAAFDLHLMTIKDLDWSIIRPSNAYCPGQLLHRVIPRAVVSGLFNQKMPLHGGGHVRKSYLHATDVSKGIETLINAPSGVYNCGADEPTKIRDVVAEVAGRFGKSLEEFCEITEGRKNEDACFWIDSTKLKSLGWRPSINLSVGISTMIEWGLKYKSELANESPAYLMRA